MPTFIKPCHGYLNSFYGPRVHPITGVRGTFHRGIDYTGAADNSIFAVASGKVRFVDSSSSRTGFGKYIIITHDNGYESVYAHLASINVSQGQRVTQGQRIGVKGTTGNSTGMHLHFELSKGRWNNRYTTNVDPLPFISDPEIETVQSVLKEAGLYSGSIDGIHGAGSIAAVKAFQKKNGMGADGVPGRGTMAMIFLEKAAVESKDWLEYDDRGPDVESLQKYLNQVGFDITVNGHYSAETKKAVMDFQETRGLAVDGVYGKGAKAEMNKALKEPVKVITKPAAKPAGNSAVKPKEEITVAQILKFSTSEGKNALITVLRRFENKEPALSKEWREKAIKNEFTESDALEVLFVAIERGYITGKVDTLALKEKVEELSNT